MAALVVYATVAEPAGDADDESDTGWPAHAWNLLRDERDFRHFVIVRTLLLVSALSTLFVVALATEDGVGLGGLDPFVIASGLAGLLGGRVFGRLADRSSQRLMSRGAGASSLVILVFLALITVPGGACGQLVLSGDLPRARTHPRRGTRRPEEPMWSTWPAETQRSDYVAVSNTAMGVLLLIAGVISSALAQLGPEVGQVFLAVLGLVGVLAARPLPGVSRADVG